MPIGFSRPSMAAGEITPAAQGRIDLAKYQVGMATIFNWFVHPHGGASTRAGTATVGEEIDHDRRSWLFSFQFRDAPAGQNYALEFGHLKMRPIMDGGYVLETAAPVLGITNANPGVVEATAHGYVNGDHVWMIEVNGMWQVNYRRFTVTVVDPDHFSIGVDTTAYGAWTSGGVVARLYTVVTPYAESDLELLKIVQNKDTMTLTHPSYQVRYLTRTDHTAWTLTIPTFAPIIQPPTGLSGTIAGTESFVITSIDRETAEESLPSAPLSGGFNTIITWTDNPDADRYNIYRKKNGLYGWIGEASDGATGYQDTTPSPGLDPDVSDSPATARNPFVGTDNYPSCAEYHEGRKWYARTNTMPQTFWSSQSAQDDNFSVSSPTRDSDAITRTVRNRKANEIRHMLSMDDLILFTSGAEFRVFAGSSSDVLTPGSTNVRPQTYAGCSQVPPVSTLDAAIFVADDGKTVLDMSFDSLSGSGGKWKTRDLSVLSEHIFRHATIVDRAYCKQPYSLLWYVLSDGTMACLTYLREHDVYAWTRHEINNARVETVCAVQEGVETVLYLGLKRGDKRYVERMASRTFTDVASHWGMDAARRYDGWNTSPGHDMKITGASYDAGATVVIEASGHTPFTADSVGQYYILRVNENQVVLTVTGYTDTTHVNATLDRAAHSSLQDVYMSDWALGISVMYGLWPLEGKSVKTLIDGSLNDSYITVVNGSATLETVGGKVLVGLDYRCDLETLNPEMQLGGSIQGMMQSISFMTMRVDNTRGLKVGPRFDKLMPIKERTTENYGSPTRVTTGDEHIQMEASWSRKGRVCIRQTYPLPATVVGIFPRLEPGDPS